MRLKITDYSKTGSYPKSVIAVEALQSRRLWTLKFSSALRSLIATGGARQTCES